MLQQLIAPLTEKEFILLGMTLIIMCIVGFYEFSIRGMEKDLTRARKR